MDQFTAAVNHALETVFVVCEKIPVVSLDDELAEPKEPPFLKVGTLLTVRSVIIYDWGVYALVLHDNRSVSPPPNDCECDKRGYITCSLDTPCPKIATELELDYLATHCNEWKPIPDELTAPALH